MKKNIHPIIKLVGFILLACVMGLEFNDTPTISNPTNNEVLP